jgi:hypothetical protein
LPEVIEGPECRVGALPEVIENPEINFRLLSRICG